MQKSKTTQYYVDNLRKLITFCGMFGFLIEQLHINCQMCNIANAIRAKAATQQKQMTKEWISECEMSKVKESCFSGILQEY